MKTIVRKILAVLFLTGAIVMLQAGQTMDVLTITIKVSPNVLNLENQGEVVTVHTDIAFNLVAGSTVTLNDVPIYYWKSDDRGNFVAKFYISAIKNLPLQIGEYNTLVLSGYTVYGQEFTGSAEIRVIRVLPKK